MQWQFGDFYFDAETRILSSNGQETILEPKTSAMLAYFCQNPQRDISREEFFTALWHGQVVTDNAINRVIALLRKVLKGEDKTKSYINTVPKIGYRFIVNVVPLSATSDIGTSCVITNDERISDKKSLLYTNDLAGLETKTLSKNKPLLQHINNRAIVAIVAITLLFILISVLRAPVNTSTEQHTNPNVSPLTRLSTNQFDADMSHNNEQLIYSSYLKGRASLFLQRNEESKPIKISLDNGSATKGRWSYDDSRVVYLFRNKQTCEFHQIDFINGIAQTPRVLYQCSASTISTLIYSQDNLSLYFVERKTKFEPYRAFKLNIITGEKSLLAQPESTGRGNHHIDLHYPTGKLLLLADLIPGETSVFEIDRDSDSYEKLLTFDYYFNNALWLHDTSGIIHQGPHPSYQLLATSLADNKSHVIVSDTRRIGDTKRINNGQDYLFSSFLTDSDIVISGQEVSDFNSSVVDYLPAISSDNEQLAFISKRSGYSKVWIKQFNNDALYSLPPENKGRNYYSLQWAFDNNYLLTNTSNGIIIYDVIEKKEIVTIKLPLPAYGVGWLSNNSIAYSLYNNNHWSLHEYNIETKITKNYAKKWAFALASKQQSILVDQTTNVYSDENTHISQLNCRFPLYNKSLTMKLDGQDFYCLSQLKASELLRLENMTTLHKKAQQLPSMGFYDYAIANGQQALTKTKSRSSDIMRTNFKAL